MTLNKKERKRRNPADTETKGENRRNLADTAKKGVKGDTQLTCFFPFFKKKKEETPS